MQYAAADIVESATSNACQIVVDTSKRGASCSFREIGGIGSRCCVGDA